MDKTMEPVPMDPDDTMGRPAQTPARDEVAALAATGGDADLARELFASFTHGLAGELETISRHGRAENWPALAEAAHRLRGATAYCGVPALDHALQQLERAAQSAALDRIRTGLLEVELEAERLGALVPD